MIGDVTVGIVVEEDLSCLKAAFSGRKEEWSLLLKETRQGLTTVILINATSQTAQFAAVFTKALERTLLSCMSRLAPFFKSTSVASTLLTAAAQWRADFPREEEQIEEP